MDENQEKMAASDAIPGARYRDPRPSDIEVFYSLMPGVLGALAAKSSDSRSANAMAFMMVREALGQCAAMGILRLETRCLDGSALATMPNQGPGAPVGAAPPVAQYPNQPGMGQPAQGPVQYPSYGAQPQSQGNAGGMKAQVVAMYPNNGPAPQLPQL